MPAWTPRSVRPATVSDDGRADEHRQRALELALHRAPPRLARPPGEAAAVVLEVQSRRRHGARVPRLGHAVSGAAAAGRSTRPPSAASTAAGPRGRRSNAAARRRASASVS